MKRKLFYLLGMGVVIAHLFLSCADFSNSDYNALKSEYSKDSLKFETQSLSFIYKKNQSTIKILSNDTFSIKQDSQCAWIDYKIEQREISITVSTNKFKKNRECNLILLNKDGIGVDTLNIVQLGKMSAEKSDVISKEENSASQTKKAEYYFNNYSGGQCAAITKKGRRCSRKAKAGSSYCWQH